MKILNQTWPKMSHFWLISDLQKEAKMASNLSPGWDRPEQDLNDLTLPYPSQG